jgi:predicted aminopeptidase
MTRGMTRTLVPVLAALLLILCIAGCESLGYYGQAASGQVSILTKRQSINKLLAAQDTPEELKTRLQLVQELLQFAERELDLPIGRQFSTYVDVQRPFVVWNVFAAPEFSMQPLSWCYPVAGCVSYRGYFREAAALAQRDKLHGEGNDVYVGGVSAYSTLGWFNDPLLSTVIRRQPHQLASLLFHELAHQVVYVRDHTEFNESFATAVELAGLQRWLATSMDASAAQSMLDERAAEQQRRREFVALVQAAVADLDRLYRSGAEASVLREGKQRRIAALREEYTQLKLAWGGIGDYDQWFSQSLNNAQLGTVATYNRLVPAFMAILQNCADELPCLYTEVQALARLPRAQRDAALQSLLPSA